MGSSTKTHKYQAPKGTRDFFPPPAAVAGIFPRVFFAVQRLGEFEGGPEFADPLSAAEEIGSGYPPCSQDPCPCGPKRALRGALVSCARLCRSVPGSSGRYTLYGYLQALYSIHAKYVEWQGFPGRVN